MNLSTYIAQAVTVDLRGDSLVVEDTKLVVIVDFYLLLAASGRVGDVKLHVE